MRLLLGKMSLRNREVDSCFKINRPSHNQIINNSCRVRQNDAPLYHEFVTDEILNLEKKQKCFYKILIFFSTNAQIICAIIICDS